MPAFTKPYTFTAHTKAKASEVNSDFDTLYNGLNSWPAAQFVGLRAYAPFVFHRTQELYVSSQLFEVFPYRAADFYEVATVYNLTFVHQGNTTKGTTTLVLKRRRSGVDTTIVTLNVPTLTAPYTLVNKEDTADVPADGDLYYLDVTAVGAIPPAAVTVYTTMAFGCGS